MTLPKRKNEGSHLLNHLYMYYPFAGEEYEEIREMKHFEDRLYCGEIEFDVRYLEFVKLGIMPLLKDMQKKGIISKPWKTPVNGIDPRHFSLALSPGNRSFKLVSNGKVLAIGSHWDDILLGCLGTLLRLKQSFNYKVTLVILCNRYTDKYYGVKQQNLEGKIEEIYEKFTGPPYSFSVIHTKTDGKIVDREFRESLILREEMRRYSEQYQDYNLIFCPPVDDEDEDHAVTGRLVRSYFREPNQTVLEYEIKKYTEGLFVPNVFIGFDTTDADAKVSLLSKIPKLIDGAERLFSEDSVRARLIVNANSYNKDRAYKYGEIFRGRIQP